MTRAAYEEARDRCAQEGFLDDLAVIVVAIGLHHHDRMSGADQPPDC